jgi:flagellar hook protein FlgE
LKQIGNSTFIQTSASGAPELGQAAEDGFGQVLSGSLERSNVDITEELVNLITSQRNYQAAAKAIETSTSIPPKMRSPLRAVEDDNVDRLDV